MTAPGLPAHCVSAKGYASLRARMQLYHTFVSRNEALLEIPTVISLLRLDNAAGVVIYGPFGPVGQQPNCDTLCSVLMTTCLG